MNSQQWERTITWDENGIEKSAIVRIRRKTQGKKDHLIAFILDQDTGRESRFAKYEIATGEWFLRPAKAVSETWELGVPPMELVRAVRIIMDVVAENLRQGLPNKS